MGLILSVLFKSAMFFLGSFFIYLSLFLYEDEEGAIQNKIQELWLKLAYKNDSLIVKFAKVFFSLIKSFDTRLSRFIGPKLFSLRVFKISFSISLLSMTLLSIFNFHTWSFLLWASKTLEMDVIYILIFFSSFALATITYTYYAHNKNIKEYIRKSYQTSTNIVFIWIWVLLLAIMPIVSSIIFDENIINSSLPAFILLLLFTLAMIYDVGAIAFIRFLINKENNQKLLGSFILFILVTSILLSIALIPLWILNTINSLNPIPSVLAGFLSFVFFSNCPSLLLISTIFLLLFYIISHKFFLFFSDRLLYAFQRYEIIKRKKYLFLIGILLISYVLGFSKTIWDKIEVGL